MRSTPRLILLTLLAALPLLAVVGCRNSSAPAPDSGTATNATVPVDVTTTETEAEPEPLLEPYDPPTLDELNAQVEWEDRPVLDPFELLKEKQAGEEPIVTVEEALKLRLETWELQKTNLGQDDYGTLMTAHNIGANYRKLERNADALRIDEDVPSAPRLRVPLARLAALVLPQEGLYWGTRGRLPFAHGQGRANEKGPGL